MEQQIKNNAGQFVLESEGKNSFLKYNISNHTLDLYSTYVPKELRGQKLGEKLVEHSIGFAKDNNLKIVPTCPFVSKYFSKHPEYTSVLSSL
jgi:uncharacterized protein